VSVDGASFRENVLFTHRGLSGPAILQISNYWKRNESVTIDLLPDISLQNASNARIQSRQFAARFVGQFVPTKVAEAMTPARLARIPVSELSRKDFESLIELLKNWRVEFRETEGYHRAEVTAGGVSTDELSSQTMMSKRVPGLFFIGEVVDVTGWLGGYNFQWAWASGYAAGQVV
jgi:predicted Rossmann fold flavoprotein